MNRHDCRRWPLAMTGVLLCCSAIALAAEATKEIAVYQWSQLRDGGHSVGGEIVTALESGPAEVLLVESTSGSADPIPVTVLDRPPITQPYYTLVGQVRYEDVKLPGYLEMWNHFPDGQSYFSRTMSPAGPMKKLSGSSGWREFQLQFFSRPGLLPSKLEVNVVLPGGGRVWLGPLTLVQTGDARAMGASQRNPYPWIDQAKANKLGGAAGGAIGLLGASIGVLASIGAAWRVVAGLLAFFIGIGVASLVAGLVALALGQPYFIYYPLFLIGVVGTVVGAGILPGLRRRYAEAELRKMRSMDASQ